MAFFHSPRIPTQGLVCAYDAANPMSYPGTGTTWYDLSGNNSHLTLSNANVWNNLGAASRMDFEDGIAKYLPGGSLTNIPGTDSGPGTIVIMSTIKAPDGDWKTLVRGADSDHQVIINFDNGVDLGMYDNDGVGFLDSGFDVTTLSDRTTQAHFMVWKIDTSSPYYNFFYDSNLSSASGTITNANATHNRGFACVGGYHNGSSSPTSYSQEWGKINFFYYYNRLLTTAELQTMFGSFRSRVGL